MEVSIIIINYNTFELTCSCIASLQKYTRSVSYEIILVDNGSKEISPDLFLERFPDIKLVKSPVNLGFTGGNNLGIQRSKGGIILLLNSDVILTEDAISKCREILKNISEIGLVSCMLKFPDGSIQKQCQRFPSIMLTIIELFRMHKLIPQPKRGRIFQNGFFDHQESIYCDSVWGAFFMFPRKILSGFKENKLPEQFFMYAEDLLWCYLIRKMGYKIFYKADTSVIHHLGASSSQSVLRFKHQNEYDFVVKYYSWFYAKILAFCRLLLYLTGYRNEYVPEISLLYFKLFITGKII